MLDNITHLNGGGPGEVTPPHAIAVRLNTPLLQEATFEDVCSVTLD